MTHQCPKWANPLGVKLTDWVAVIAFILSVGALLWTAFARQLYPSTDISFPDEIQLQCTQYDKKYTCDSDSPVVLIADLFSIWNDSIVSTKPQILRQIDATIESNSFNDSLLKWKYFTEVVDSANKQKGNAGRAILYYGDLRNLEVEFHQNQVSNTRKYTWTQLSSSVADEDIAIGFRIDLAYGSDIRARCTLSFRPQDLTRFKKGKYASPYVVANSTCKEVSQE